MSGDRALNGRSDALIHFSEPQCRNVGGGPTRRNNRGDRQFAPLRPKGSAVPLVLGRRTARWHRRGRALRDPAGGPSRVSSCGYRDRGCRNGLPPRFRPTWAVWSPTRFAAVYRRHNRWRYLGSASHALLRLLCCGGGATGQGGCAWASCSRQA